VTGKKYNGGTGVPGSEERKRHDGQAWTHKLWPQQCGWLIPTLIAPHFTVHSHHHRCLLSPLPFPRPLFPQSSSMMLVQKPQSIFPISPAQTHRRVPSAPVVVQPTRTPGLLTLSKPPRKAHPPSQQRHAAKSVTKPTKSTPVARAQLLTPAPEISDKKPAMPATPSPHPRGRSHAKVVKESVPVHRYILVFMHHR